jgi:hypothetical protein
MAFIGNTNTTQAFTPAIDYFSGNGSTTAFTLSRPVASVAQVQVTIDNVAQNPSSAFTVSANTITFTSAPLSGTNNIYVYYTSPITQVIAPGQGTVTSESFGTITNFTTTGNTVLGDATTDTLTVGVTGIVKDSSGNVGIGGTPVKTLSILPTSIRRMDFYVRDPGVDDSLVIRSQHATNNNIRDMILEGSTVKAYFNAMSLRDGNLLVGVTSTFSPGGVPTTTSVSTGTAGNWALGIRHTSSASNPYGLAIQYPNSAPNAVSAQFIFCQDSAGTKFDVRSNGGIGNYSANNVNLSDQREKKNIELAGNYLNKICQIPVKTFLFNDQTDTDLNLGAIAQDVQAVCPELVMESNWGSKEEPKMRLSIYQTDLQYALMKSIQELKALNDTQAETINALTARIVALEGR